MNLAVERRVRKIIDDLAIPSGYTWTSYFGQQLENVLRDLITELNEANQKAQDIRTALEKIAGMPVDTTPGSVDSALTVAYLRSAAEQVLKTHGGDESGQGTAA